MISSYNKYSLATTTDRGVLLSATWGRLIRSAIEASRNSSD
jgi:hypothetical protein